MLPRWIITFSTFHASTSVYQINKRQPKRDNQNPKGKGHTQDASFLFETRKPEKAGKGQNQG